MMTSQKRNFILKMAKAKNALASGVGWSALLSVFSCFSPQETAHAKSGEFHAMLCHELRAEVLRQLISLMSSYQSFFHRDHLPHTTEKLVVVRKAQHLLIQKLLEPMHFAVGLPSYIPVGRFCPPQPTADRSNNMGFVPLKEVKKANDG